MEPCKKFRTTGNSQDHISELPLDVVGNILSRISTKDAMKTSVISRNWKYKWTSIYNIEIDDECSSLHGDERITGFLNFVNKILSGTREYRIGRFHLFCTRVYEPKFLETWISQISTRSIENIKIVAPLINRLDSQMCIFDWASLTSLSLWLSCTILFPVNTCLSNLKRLWLTSGNRGPIEIKMEHVPATGRVIMIFPILEVLVLNKCKWLDVSIVEIHAPELISFKTTCLRKLRKYRVKIFGPKLAVFESCGNPIKNLLLDAPAVSCADFSYFQPRNDARRARIILEGFSDLKCLKLSPDNIKTLLQWKSRHVSPTFNQLKELHLGVSWSPSSQTSEDLMKLLLVIPTLELLNISTSGWSLYRAPWEPNFLPPTILSNLKKVELIDFLADKPQLGFAKFILENARNLEEMLVFLSYDSCMGVEESSHLLLKLIPKMSSCVLIVKMARELWIRSCMERENLHFDSSKFKSLYMDRGSSLKREAGKKETDGSSVDIISKESKIEEESQGRVRTSALTVLKYDHYLEELVTIHHEDDMVIPYGRFNDYDGLLEHLLSYLGIPIYPRFCPLPQPPPYIQILSDYYFRNLTGVLYHSNQRRDDEGRIIRQFSCEHHVRPGGKFSTPPNDAHVNSVPYVSALLRTKNSVDFLPWALCGKYCDGRNKNYAPELEAMAECVLVIWGQNDYRG